MSNLWRVVRLARLYNSLLPLLAIIAGFRIAGGHDVWLLSVAAVLIILTHSLVTIWNDIEDQEVDVYNGITTLARVHGDGVFRELIWTLVGVAGCIFLGSLLVPVITMALFALLILLGWTYNSEPIRASRRPIMSMVVLWVVYGIIPFAIGASLGTAFNWLVILMAIAWSLGRVSLSLLKDYKDAPGDASAGKRTFLLVYGGKKVAQASIMLAAIGYAGCLIGCAYHAWRPEIIVMIGIAGWLLFERTRLFRRRSYEGLNRVFHHCLHYQLIFDGMVVVWFSI